MILRLENDDLAPKEREIHETVRLVRFLCRFRKLSSKSAKFVVKSVKRSGALA